MWSKFLDLKVNGFAFALIAVLVATVLGLFISALLAAANPGQPADVHTNIPGVFTEHRPPAKT